MVSRKGTGARSGRSTQHPRLSAPVVVALRKTPRDPSKIAREANLWLFIDQIEPASNEVRIRGSKAVLAHAVVFEAPIWYQVPNFGRECWSLFNTGPLIGPGHGPQK